MFVCLFDCIFVCLSAANTRLIEPRSIHVFYMGRSAIYRPRFLSKNQLDPDNAPSFMSEMFVRVLSSFFRQLVEIRIILSDVVLPEKKCIKKKRILTVQRPSLYKQTNIQFSSKPEIQQVNFRLP